MSIEVPCHQCGYDVRAQPEDGRCPECEASVAESRRVAGVPVRPGWGESDPRWRRRVLAGVWLLVLLPGMNAMEAFGWAARVPAPNFLPYQGAVTALQDTLLSWPWVYQTLVFCVGVALLFSKERGRRRGRLDWTRRWGVICSYVVLLLGAVQILSMCALVLAGIAALFMYMPPKYQPGITQLCVNVSTTCLVYLHAGPVADVLMVAFSSIAMIFACVALFDALRSSGPKRWATALLAPLAAIALVYLLQAGQYFVRFGMAPSAALSEYGLYFWPDVLVRRMAGLPPVRGVPGTGVIACGVEIIKWCDVVAIAVWLSVAQVKARRRGREGSGA